MTKSKSIRTKDLVANLPRRLEARIRELASLTRHPWSTLVPAYWYYDSKNFGDSLTPWLLPKYGMVAHLADPSRAEVAGVGSILARLPATYAGIIWGSGLIREKSLNFPEAKFLAVRGELTARCVGAPSRTPLGDPGLLVARHVPRPTTQWSLGLIPHKIHRSDPTFQIFAKKYPGDVKVIDVTRSPDRVCSDIAACAGVVSSSLHGLIAADSFGIPAAWFTGSRPLIGGEFKFHDHESVVSDAPRRMDIANDTSLGEVVARLMPARVERVENAISHLERSALLLSEILRGRSAS